MEAEEAGGGVMKGGAHERMGVGGGGEAGSMSGRNYHKNSNKCPVIYQNTFGGN